LPIKVFVDGRNALDPGEVRPLGCATEALVVAKAGARRKRSWALVTGGAGFLGSHLCEQLLAEGYRVVCMDNLRTGSLEDVAHLKDEPDFEYIDHDATSYIDVPGELGEIYHFASPASPKDFRRILVHEGLKI